MNHKALRILEYEMIVNRLVDLTSSSMGKNMSKNIKPLNNIDEINLKQQETEEGLSLILALGSPGIFGVKDLKLSLKHVEKGGSMSPRELLDVSDQLRSAKSMKKYLGDTEDNKIKYPILSGFINSLTTNTALESTINGAIISQDEISDNASGELARIRRAQVIKSQNIRDKLASIIRNSGDVLQDNIVTMREGRYVVPVKVENKNSVKGIVHDQSSSGATVFIEPMVVVELNNELRMLEAKEEEEIKRILREISLEALEIADEIITNQGILTELDFIFAKSKLALEMDGTKPKLNSGGYIDMKKARHPGIDKKKVVPIDIYLGDDYNTLVITGPNTGGKTVTLKTVGLLTLMAQSGLHIPCDFGSSVAVFEEIFADIGDEQSIEQSLSTFSSHMTNIVSILKEIKYNSLVLFDELGAGTDPTEGAALAIAILDRLLKKGIRTIATTHYSQLKLFALTTEGVKNGAVEFDVNTLSPTYKLQIGIPGKSNAFEISRRLGLDNSIIEESKGLISQENQEFEDVLANIERDRKLALESKEKQQRLENEVIELQKKLELEVERTKEKREKIISKANEEAYQILREAKEMSQDFIKELRFMKDSKEKDNQRLLQLESDLRRNLDRRTNKEALLKVSKSQEKQVIDLGSDVEILGLNEVGEVLTKPDKKGEVMVQVGIMKISANIKNLKLVENRESEKSKSNIKSIIKNKASKDVKRELDLRGLNIEEAIVEIDRYLDDAYIVGLKEVYLIHGKGTGALRDGVQRYIKKNKHAKSFRTGGFSEGGTGVTVVEIK